MRIIMGILTMLCALIGCNAQNEGKNAARILVKNGFKVIELDAGYNGWTSKGMPITK